MVNSNVEFLQILPSSVRIILKQPNHFLFLEEILSLINQLNTSFWRKLEHAHNNKTEQLEYTIRIDSHKRLTYSAYNFLGTKKRKEITTIFWTHLLKVLTKSGKFKSDHRVLGMEKVSRFLITVQRSWRVSWSIHQLL